MSFKKLLGVVFVLIVVMFTLMLATSYAWYSFSGASTTFDVVTGNDDIVVSFQRGEYINTNIAVPIASDYIDQYSEKSNFTIQLKNRTSTNSMMVTISLVDLVINQELQNNNFKIDLYHQGQSVSSITGDSLTNGEDSMVLGNITLDNDIDNQFELRVYILDNGEDQSSMMNKAFQAKIKIDVVSRLNTSTTDYTSPDIYISSILIDGESSKTLPVTGYYEMSASCDKGSQLSWDSLHKTITYAKGSKINDSCRLTFTSSTNYPLLSSVQVGSYITYTGNNGCEGKSCLGENANYVSDTSMGYCTNRDNQYTSNGWRIAYVKDGSAYLISAGALECLCSNEDGTLGNGSCNVRQEQTDITSYLGSLNQRALKYCNKEYAYGGVCDSNSTWIMGSADFEAITGGSFQSNFCYQSGSNRKCGYTNDLIDNGGYYWYGNISDTGLYGWNPMGRYIDSYQVGEVAGIRPVLRMDASVVIVGGSGTYIDPYQIKNA